VLVSARENGVSLAKIFERLPRRFSKAGLIDNFPQEVSKKILARFSPENPAGKETVFKELEKFFSKGHGFGNITDINAVDGIRIFFSNGDIAHIRPSGNAPQLRIYSNADTQERANIIVKMSIAEPDGILRKVERFVK
jgi:phosphomannomutase